jgi:hypothetical protein
MLSCRSCRPNAPFAELVRLSRTSIADEMRVENIVVACWANDRQTKAVGAARVHSASGIEISCSTYFRALKVKEN